MASRFATVSKDEILAVNEATLPTNTKKKTKFALSMFTGRYEKVFLLNLQQNHKKMIPKSLSIVWRLIKVNIQTSEFVTLCFICPVTILPPIQIYLTLNSLKY